MNIENVISKANEILGPVEQVGEQLYKGRINVLDKTAGIYFIDFDQGITLEKFGEYQDQLLSEEYYNLNEDQQWNFYLFLLRDTIDQDFKSEVEKNVRYARKYVLKEQDFEDFFTIDRSKGPVKTTIIEDWKESLDLAGIQEVYGDGAMTEVGRKLDNGFVPPSRSARSRSSDAAEEIKFIKMLKLNESYRVYPKYPRSYNFRKVNLVRGINGTGKTSLFEAIELALCGMTYRNPSVKEKDGCIEVVFDSSKVPEICKPSKAERYKSRDKFWYNNPVKSLNRAHYSFNRFNYFNADAAHRFANSGDEDSIRKALFNIILGPEYDHIVERAEKILKKIRPDFNKLESARNHQQFLLEEATTFIEKWQPDEQMVALANSIDAAIQNLNPRLDLEKIAQEQLPIEKFISDSSNLLSGLIGYGVDTQQAATDKISQTNQLSIQVTTFKEALAKNLELIRKIDSDKKTVESKQQLLTSLQPYFSNPILFRMEGLQERLSSLESGISRIEAVEVKLKDINWSAFSLDQTIVDLMKEATTKKEQEIQLLHAKEAEFSEVLQKLGKIQSVIQEIKILGKRYSELEPNADSCPLCRTEFLPTDLGVLLANLEEEDDIKVDMDSQKQLIEKMKENIELYEKEINSLYQIQSAIVFLGNAELSDVSTLRALQDNVASEFTKLPEHKKKLQAEKTLQDLAKEFNITEQAFRELKNRIEIAFPDIRLVAENEQLFSKEADALRGVLKDLSERHDKMYEQRAQLGLPIKMAFEIAPDQSIQLSIIEAELSKKANESEAIQRQLKQLGVYIDVSSVSFTELLELLRSIKADVDIFKDNLERQVKLAEMKKQQSNASTFISNTKDKFYRYNTAVATLNEILEASASDQVNSFLRQYLGEIIDIFKSIHSPREFATIFLSDEGVELETNKGERRSITQISTGQRSALAISIFLALNRSLQHGPNIILFDDPVAFIDDLNALSFLDYLKFFVLKENKQIFFATANHKLATLFHKKFSFLNDDYYSWTLERGT